MLTRGRIALLMTPCTDTRDISNLLGRAGFTLLTVDVDEVKVSYPSMFELVEDLRDMGESNAIIGRSAGHPPPHLVIQANLPIHDRRHFLHRDTLAAASAIYKG